MADSTVWWILAAACVAAELITGTFYLLMLALGMAVGALAAHLGLGLTGQLVAAAVAGSGAVVALQRLRPRPPQSPPHESNADVNLDIGQTLQVAHWLPDGTARATYRGAQWTVECVPSPGTEPPQAGMYRITEVHGSRLRVVSA